MESCCNAVQLLVLLTTTVSCDQGSPDPEKCPENSTMETSDSLSICEDRQPRFNANQLVYCITVFAGLQATF